MVGSFYRVFFVTMAMLVVNSEALKCVVKGDLSDFAGLPQNANNLMQGHQFDLNMKAQEECDGVCAFTYMKIYNKTTEVSGCQDVPPSAKDKPISVSIMHTKSAEIIMDLLYVTCAEDNCNDGGKLMNIMDVVKSEAAVLNKPRSTDLQCSGTTGSCQGFCAVAYGDRGTEAKCEDGIKTLQYYVMASARRSNGRTKTFALVGCATNNCNAVGGEANTVLNKIKTKLEAEVNSSGNISYGFVLAIFISIISSI